MSGTTIPTASVPRRNGLRIDIQQPQDSDVERERRTRWGVLLSTVALSALSPVYFAYYLTSQIGPNAEMVGLIVGIIGAAELTKRVLWRVLVSNEEWKAYATLNPFNGKRVLYGPGLHPAYPWEERNAAGEISLRVVSVGFEVAVPTRTANIIAEGVFEYQVDLEHLANYIGVDPSTIETGFVAYVSSFLTSQISNGTMEEAREKINALNDAVADEFMGTAIPATLTSHATSTVTEFEFKFGIRVVSVFISKMKLPPEVQRTRDGQDEAIRISLVCADLMGMTKAQLDAKVADGTISQDQLADLQRRAMVITGNATASYDRLDGGGAGVMLTRPLS